MAMDLHPRDDDAMIADINMTPLVDVMLVLLIVFMVTMPVLTHAVRVDLPKATSSEQLARPETVTLSVGRDATLHWNADPVSPAELQQRLAQAATHTPQPEVHIRGDRAVDYGAVLRVMAAVHRAGLVKIGFVSEPER